jgi:thiopurine S-methyltransferase
LTALSEKVRKLYVGHVRAIVPLDCSMFLFTTENVCPEGETSLLPSQGEPVDDEIETLYGPYFMIQIVHTETAWESD